MALQDSDLDLLGHNVLISSAGRRVGLVRAFQEALRPIGGRVIATDTQPELSAACRVADESAAVPPNSNPEFLPSTLEVARTTGVGLVIPTLDTELAAFASVRDDWLRGGVLVSVSSPDLVQRSRDKRATGGLFEEIGIPALREEAVAFPRFVKPLAGSLSKDTHVVATAEELPERLEDHARFIHQELIDSAQYREYSVDALYSRSGRLVCAVPRHRIEVRGGEISKGRTEKGELLSFLRPRLASIEGASGCLTVQVFYSPGIPERPVIGIEINARFGGGFPMAHAAGGRFADWIVEETFMGGELSYRSDWKEGATFLRYDDHVAFGC